jgi:GT2 family glycosyltransferase
VLVVDDGGTEPIRDLAAKYRGALRLSITSQVNQGPAMARNTGAFMARGRYLAFIDDDCLPRPGWLSGLLKTMLEYPGAGAGGLTLNGLPANIYSAASHFIHQEFSRKENRDASGAAFFASNNLAVPAEGFTRLGGFDASFGQAGGEDRDFCQRWRDAGGRLISSSQAVVDHCHRMSLTVFLRQQMHYGLGAYQLARSQVAQAGGGISARLAFSMGLSAAPWKEPKVRRKMAMSLLCILSQASVGFGYLKAAFSPR